MKKIAFFLPVLADYRKDFFFKLTEKFEKNAELMIFYGSNSGMKKEIINLKPNIFSSKGFQSVLLNFFGFRLIWIKKMINETLKYSPDAFVFLFNPGVINFSLIIFFCILTQKKWYIWSCGFERKDLSRLQKIFRKLFLNLFYKNATGIFTYGYKFAEILVNSGINKEKIIIAQNTINIEEIVSKPKLNKNEARSIINFKNSADIFMYVGAIIKSKNLDVAIKVFSELIKENMNIFFIIIGNGPQFEILENIIGASNNNKNIILLPAKYGEELLPYFCAADVFVSPGTGGLAINEAMAYSLPIIATQGDGTILDLVIEGENGFLLDDNLNNLKEKINNWLLLSKIDKERMSNNSKEFVLQKASLKNMVDKFASGLLNP